MDSSRVWNAVVGVGFLTVFATGCGHVAKTAIVPKGQVDVGLGLGGPLANVPTVGVVPLPLSTVGVSAGLGHDWDISAHYQATAQAFGVTGVDLGTSYQPLHQDGWVPSAILTGRLYGFTDFKSGFAPYLELEGTLNWRYAKRWATYCTVDGLFQLRAPPIFNMGVGEEVRLGRVALQLEGRWYQPSADTFFTAVDWVGVGNHGAVGLIFGIRVALGGDS